MSEKWDCRFLEMARLVAGWSKDPSTKAGAVIVRPNKSVKSVGFNGFPKTMPDTAELYANRDEKYSRIVHCEVNAAIHSEGGIEGCTLYTYPFISCDRCCVQMIQGGIIRMVAPIPSADALTRWATFFEKTRIYCKESGVELIEIPFL